MKNTKRFLAALTATGLLFTGAVFAAEEDIMLIDETPAEDVMLIDEAQTDALPVVNGASIGGIEAVDVDGVLMIPLRYVFESLGYTVTWHDEDMSIDLIKGAQFITMQIGEDAYAFSRQAHRALGAAPTLVNDTTTYIPITFITEILGGAYLQAEDGTYTIINPATVTLTEVLEDGSLLVSDSYLGDVLVHIAETTKITDGLNPVDASVLESGMTLAVGYDVAMTMSLPPQTVAHFIRVEGLPVEEEVVEAMTFSGTITEVVDGLVVVGNPEDAGSVALVIAEDTVIEGGTAADLTVGTKIEGTYGPAATFSLPPQSVALTVTIVK